MTTPTPGADVRGEVAVGTGPNLDNVGDPDVIGWFGLEYDGPVCAGDDCESAVEDDGQLCDDCGDQPHEFRQDNDVWPDFCVCGRIRSIGGYSPVHTDGAQP